MSRISIGLALEGDKKLQRKLAKLPNAMNNKIARPALRAGAKLIADETKKNARAASTRGSRESILKRVAARLKVRAMKRSRTRVGFRILTPPKEQLGLSPSHKWYPPAHIELGTRKTKAIPYMRKALADKRAAALEKIRTTAWTKLKAVVR